MAGSESHGMGMARQSYSRCRYLYAKVGAQCLERASARASAICHKMLEKELRNGRNNSREISLRRQGEGEKSVKGRSTPVETPHFPSSGFSLESWSWRLSGGQKRPGLVTEVAAFQQWAQRLLRPARLGGRGWSAQTMCPPRLRPSEPGSSVWAEPVGNRRGTVNHQALWHPIEIDEVPVNVLLF